MTITSLLQKAPIIPVITIDKLEHAVPLAKALLEGGLNVLEVTLRTNVAIDAIAAITKAMPDCQVGAGTVLKAEQFSDIGKAGASFAVCPGITFSLVEAANKQNMPFLPGVTTPSEVIAAQELGCDVLKFFPANLFGGVNTLKAYVPLFQGIQFCPTGGVNPDNAKEYLALPNVISVGGSWLAPKDLIEKENWNAITKIAKKTLKRIKS